MTTIYINVARNSSTINIEGYLCTNYARYSLKRKPKNEPNFILKMNTKISPNRFHVFGKVPSITLECPSLLTENS